MDDMAAYYAAPPPPPPGIHSSLYPHPQYHHPPPPHQPSLGTPPPLAAPLHHIPPPSLHSPPPSASAFSRSSHSLYDEVRTLFVAGLPEDVKPREIYNLFREFPGYESSNLRPITRNNQPFAFAVFSDQQSAVAAMHALNVRIYYDALIKRNTVVYEGMVFDLEKGSTLYIDLAKSNSRSKRQRTDDEGPHLDKKFKGSPVYSRGSYDLGKMPHDTIVYKLTLHMFFHGWALAGVGSFHNPGMGNSAYNTIGYTSTQSNLNFDGRGIGEADAARLKDHAASRAAQNNPPCPTIFVANLGPNCTEQELIQVFSRCRGYLKLKIQSTYGSPVAFVDFQDTASSTEALNQLQGTVLYSSTSGEGLRLEYPFQCKAVDCSFPSFIYFTLLYAKSRMGMRRKPNSRANTYL
ncbi:hypothetical protein Cgig2_025426 [Carnegiea gigantea]|uniref:RRM domain-containing protein n=1 Tax=Carnegiea gigantea TaxID=171969 RepID=A0A9Q1JZT7_9CARY|nr:hypothetical protein Cgig2_025426 [Carnegiea gigantea]